MPNYSNHFIADYNEPATTFVIQKLLDLVFPQNPRCVRGRFAVCLEASHFVAMQCPRTILIVKFRIVFTAIQSNVLKKYKKIKSPLSKGYIAKQWRTQKFVKGGGLQVENTIIKSGSDHGPKAFPNLHSKLG